jgi:hypothetical protein
MGTGVVAGFPVIGLKATLLDGGYHDVDSSVLAFEIAGRAAARKGLRAAQARLMEPVMKVEVTTPEESMGDVIGDINSRRGMVQELVDKKGNVKLVRAKVPLSEMFQVRTGAAPACPPACAEPVTCPPAQDWVALRPGVPGPPRPWRASHHAAAPRPALCASRALSPPALPSSLTHPSPARCRRAEYAHVTAFGECAFVAVGAPLPANYLVVSNSVEFCRILSNSVEFCRILSN